MNLERIIELHPAFDKRDPNPNKNYGVHGVDLLMAVKGEHGVVQFILFTGWMLPHVEEEIKLKTIREIKNGNRPDIQFEISRPQPADIGYHSKKPLWEGQERYARDGCRFMGEGEKCYYDGSSLQAIEVYKILVEKGSDGVWEELERRYRELFLSEDKS